MKQEGIPCHTETFFPIMRDIFMYLLCYAQCIALNSQVFVTKHFPYLNSFWETADQRGSNNWFSTVPAGVLMFKKSDNV